MAQLVEQLIRNQQVAGSNPAISSKKTAPPESGAVFLDISNWFRVFVRAIAPERSDGLHTLL